MDHYHSSIFESGNVIIIAAKIMGFQVFVNGSVVSKGWRMKI